MLPEWDGRDDRGNANRIEIDAEGADAGFLTQQGDAAVVARTGGQAGAAKGGHVVSLKGERDPARWVGCMWRRIMARRHGGECRW